MHSVYEQDYIHTLSDDAKISLEDYHITINCPLKLNFHDGELVGEFNSLWPVLNKTWLQFKESKPSSSRMKGFWLYILKEYLIEYRNAAGVVLLLMSISKLAKIFLKDRGRISAEWLLGSVMLAINSLYKNMIDHLLKNSDIVKQKLIL